MRDTLVKLVLSMSLFCGLLAPVVSAKERPPTDMRSGDGGSPATLICIDSETEWHDLRISRVDGRSTASLWKGLASSVLIDPGRRKVIIANIKFAQAVYVKFEFEVESGKTYECVIVRGSDGTGFSNEIREKGTGAKVAEPYAIEKDCHPSIARCTE
jgi:hypothetical protein